MDFVEWCDLVLSKVLEVTKVSPETLEAGVYEPHLAPTLFGMASAPEPKRTAMFDAVLALTRIGLLQEVNKDRSWTITREGRAHAADPIPLWERICAMPLEQEEEQLLRLFNQLGVQRGADHAWLEQVGHETAASQPTCPGGLSEVHAVARGLVSAGLLQRFGPDLIPTYAGVVWETRRDFTTQSRWIDRLVKEWETTSVEFKRELHTNTAEGKADLIKEIIGLANTKAGGQHWLIIGFDDKTHDYHGPPDPGLRQEHLERLITEYIQPYVGVRYQVVDYRRGPIGMLEVLRDSTKRPYAVRRSIMGAWRKRLIIKGQRFVRHGSLTEMPTGDELRALQAEGEEARVRR